MKSSKWGQTFALGTCLAACASTAQEANGPHDGTTVERRDTTIVHEPCDHEDDRAVARDANRDGKPDLITVSEGGRLVCQWLDLNFDGLVDAWVYFDQSGQVRRRETDYDRDGRIDEIALLKNGQIQSRKRATTLAGRIDTWEHFENGVLRRAERDADGNAVLDQWWEYPLAQRPECPIIHSDVDGDGRPDPGATVNLCADELAENGAAELSEPPSSMSENVTDDAPTDAPAPAPVDSAANAPASEESP